MGKFFGTDGIRGTANVYPITPEVALQVGRALAVVCHAKGDGTVKALLGKDTRLSGYMLETALTSGLVSMGMDVLEVGPMPTPAVAHLVKSMTADCGIMITASHNPSTDNGIKIFSADGYKLPDSVEDGIERIMIANERPAVPPPIGKAYRIDDARGRYIAFAKTSIGNARLKGIRAVLDCANGAAYAIAPTILRELGVQVTAVGVTPDGTNINAGCGATHPELISRLVRETGADVGISLDGDADRVIFSDENGNIVNGDRIIGLCAIDFKEQGRLPGNSIAVTSMSNMGLIEAMTKAGIRTEITAVGDRYVIERMKEKNIGLGGEQSGHLIFLNYSTTGDGILSALHVLKLMKQKQQKLSEMASFMTEFPQSLVSIAVKMKPAIAEVPGLSGVVRQAEAALGNSGRVVVRYSGTENKIRVLVEARTKQDVAEWNDRICAVVRKELC